MSLRHFTSILFFFLAGSWIVADTKPPIESFFNWSEIMSPEVSPDGNNVAFLMPMDGRMALMLFDLKTGKMEPLARGYDGDITYFFWKGNERIVFMSDPNGHESWAIFAVTLKNKEIKVLSEAWSETHNDAEFAGLVDELRYDPVSILIYGRAPERGFHTNLYRLNILTSDRWAVFGADSTLETGDWEPDSTGAIRYRIRTERDKVTHEARPDEKSNWKTIITDDPLFPTVHFHGFAANNREIYLSREKPDGSDTLYSYDTTTGQWSAPIFESEAQIDSVIFSWTHDEILGVQYGRDGRSVKWFNPQMAKLSKMIRTNFPAQYDVRFTSADEHRKVFIVSVSGDTNPGVYYLLDTRGKLQFVELGKTHPSLKPELLQPMKEITYKARDGLLIHGYLTLPKGAEGKRVPLILNPHGGPYGIHDHWGFNPEVQFLASRGYAVLQPNYRGSSGYGSKFYFAGRHEWGRKMQDDLTDAVKWAIDQGIADPKRVIIYGGSYGGYAALAGATFTPDLYCCAINYVGVSDMAYISDWRHEDSESGKAYYRDMIGDDSAYIHEVSPVYHVDQIKIPTLHAYGENDPRVDIKNWHELKRELDKYHKTYEYVYERNQGHGFREEKARLNFYRHMEAFLAKYVPTAQNPAPAGVQEEAAK